MKINKYIRFAKLSSSLEYIYILNPRGTYMPLFLGKKYMDALHQISTYGYYEDNIIVQKLSNARLIDNDCNSKDLIHRRSIDYLMQKAYDSRTPLECVMEITSNCQLSCKYCYDKRNKVNNQLEFDIINKILPQIKDIGVIKISITGGEPFLHPNILNILDLLASYDFLIEIQTNAILLDKSIIRHIKFLGNTNLQISYHSNEEVVFDNFVGVSNSLKKLKSVISLLQDEEQHFTLTFNLTNENKTQAISILEDFDLKGIDYIINSEIYPLDNKTNLEFVCSDIDILSKIINKKYAHLNYEYFLHQSCDATKLKFRIASNGDLIICLLINRSYGNIYSMKIEDFWNHVGNDFKLQGELFRTRVGCESCEDLDVCSKCNAYFISDKWDFMKPIFCQNAKIIKQIMKGDKIGK